MSTTRAGAVVLGSGLLPLAAGAQTAAPELVGPVVHPAGASDHDSADHTSGFTGFLRDVGSDDRHVVSRDSAGWRASRGVAALAVHGATT
jgi:hypothetical protein